LTNAGVTSDGSNLTSTVGWNGTTASYSSNLTVAGDLNVTGEINVNTNMFTVDPSNGNVGTGDIVAGSIEVGGDLSLNGDFITFDNTNININSGDFTLDAATKSVVMAGDLRVDGTTFASVNLEMSGDMTIDGSSALNGGITVDTNKFTVEPIYGTTFINTDQIILDGNAGSISCTSDLNVGNNLNLNGDLLVGTDMVIIDSIIGGIECASLSSSNSINALGDLTVTGSTIHNGQVGSGSMVHTSLHSGSYEVALNKRYHGFTTNGTGDIFASLADGIPGQVISIHLLTRVSNNVVITPANFYGGTTITLNSTGDLVSLLFNGTDWVATGAVGDPVVV
jgi:hypothetical protein